MCVCACVWVLYTRNHKDDCYITLEWWIIAIQRDISRVSVKVEGTQTVPRKAMQEIQATIQLEIIRTTAAGTCFVTGSNTICLLTRASYQDIYDI